MSTSTLREKYKRKGEKRMAKTQVEETKLKIRDFSIDIIWQSCYVYLELPIGITTLQGARYANS